MTRIARQPTRALLQSRSDAIASPNQIDQRRTRRHVTRRFAHPTLSVLDRPLQIAAQAMELHCCFIENGQVASPLQKVQMLFGLLPAPRAGQEGNDESQ